MAVTTTTSLIHLQNMLSTKSKPLPYCLSVCCGHVYCKSCLDNTKKITATFSACPMCRDQEFIVYSNKQLDYIVRSLKMFCSKKFKGCKWQGEMNNVKVHLEDCQFEKVNVKRECNGNILQFILKATAHTVW